MDIIKEDIEQVQDKMQMLIQLVERCCLGDDTSSLDGDYDFEDGQEIEMHPNYRSRSGSRRSSVGSDERESLRGDEKPQSQQLQQEQRQVKMEVSAAPQASKPMAYRSPASIAHTHSPAFAAHLTQSSAVASPAPAVDVSEIEDIMALSPISRVEDEDLELLNETIDKAKAESAKPRGQNLQAKFDEASLQTKLAALSSDQQDDIVNQLVSCVLAEGNSRSQLLETLQATLQKVSNGEITPQRQRLQQRHQHQQQHQQSQQLHHHHHAHQKAHLQPDRSGSPRFHDLSHQEQKMNVVYS